MVSNSAAARWVRQFTGWSQTVQSAVKRFGDVGRNSQYSFIRWPLGHAQLSSAANAAPAPSGAHTAELMPLALLDTYAGMSFTNQCCFLVATPNANFNVRASGCGTSPCHY
jgi:hypothetical protein